MTIGDVPCPLLAEHPHGLSTDHQELVESISVFSKDLVQSGQTDINLRRDETEIHHADMLATMPDDEITIVAIFRDEHAALTDTDGENLGVIKVDRIVPADPRHVVAKSTKVRDNGNVGTRIDDEPHERAVTPINWSCLRSLCSRSRAMRA